MVKSNFFKQCLEFVSERIPVEKISYEAMVQKKSVPHHKMSWAYYLGGLTLLFLSIQFITGILLLFYYQATVSDAHSSVEHITQYVGGGDLIRNLHAWSSSLMILCLILHMMTTFAMKAFQRPRELTWITGVVLLLLTFALGFSGYLLPWHQIGVNATKVGLQSIELIGAYLPGELALLPTKIKEIIQGDSMVEQATLSRFFALHVVVCPILLLGILGFHLFSIQLHGMSEGVDHPTGKSEKFFPTFILKDLRVWSVVFCAAFITALCIPFDSFSPFPLLAPYDALGSTPPGIKPEWYFFFIYYPLELLPFWLIALLQNLLLAILFLAPWIFKNTSRKALFLITLVAAIYFFGITIFGQDLYNLIMGVHS
ncbi:MAG: cytochrome bc complex cytochrome b subunit [Oligoflexia bacterium]|nr:cytochrome bc complex cytochrome b subunit [Oligoflexia bacterium]MBF0365620.1 cytochrome bc complex cytochrome b subunit [Oligoflexia bacterium]